MAYSFAHVGDWGVSATPRVRRLLKSSYTTSGYTSSADAHSLTITPGPKPITLQRSDLERLGLAIRDDYQIPLSDERDDGQLAAGILSALTEALSRCEGQKHA